MGLLKAVPTDFGVSATYHHIGAVLTEYPAKTCQVTLLSYLDKPARDAGARPMTSVIVPVSGEQFQFATGDPTRAELYGLISALPEFADSEPA